MGERGCACSVDEPKAFGANEESGGLVRDLKPMGSVHACLSLSQAFLNFFPHEGHDAFGFWCVFWCRLSLDRVGKSLPHWVQSCFGVLVSGAAQIEAAGSGTGGFAEASCGNAGEPGSSGAETGS